MRMHSREQARLIEEAQDWEQALRSGGPAERQAFAAWIRRSPEHLQAYLQHLSLQAELEGLDNEKAFDLDALLAQSSGNVVPFKSEPSRPEGAQGRPVRLRRRWYGYAAVTVGALLIAGISFWYARSTWEWTDYVTATGEQRRIALSDGSTIELNTQSHVRVAYRARTREVELMAGEALFSVQHNADRPFRVHTRNTVIDDVGTQFAIYIRPDATTTVSVLEGRVQLSEETSVVSPTEVAAGEEVHIDANGKVVGRVALNIAEAASWRQHRLWFENASLEQVAAEFNRYNSRKIQIAEDPVVAKKRYTATWDPYDPQSLIQYLQSDPTLIVQTEQDQTLIRAR